MSRYGNFLACITTTLIAITANAHDSTGDSTGNEPSQTSIPPALSSALSRYNMFNGKLQIPCLVTWEAASPDTFIGEWRFYRAELVLDGISGKMTISKVEPVLDAGIAANCQNPIANQ